MNLWEKILNLSNLPECRSVAEHICSITNEIGNVTYIIRNPIFGKTKKSVLIEGKLKSFQILKGKVQKENLISGRLKKENLIIGIISKNNIKGRLK